MPHRIGNFQKIGQGYIPAQHSIEVFSRTVVYDSIVANGINHSPAEYLRVDPDDLEDTLDRHVRAHKALGKVGIIDGNDNIVSPPADPNYRLTMLLVEKAGEYLAGVDLAFDGEPTGLEPIGDESILLKFYLKHIKSLNHTQS